MMGHSETLCQQLDPIYYTLFCMSAMLLHPLRTVATKAIMLSQNHFRKLDLHKLEFFHLTFQVYSIGSHTEHPWRCSKNSSTHAPIFEHEPEILKRLELINNKPLRPINTSDRSGAGLRMCLGPLPASAY
jgi:hypothetical protein